jgi:hypothetical protein
VGSFSRHVANSVVLSRESDRSTPNLAEVRPILEAAVFIFQPENGVVTSDDLLDRAGAEMPWEAGWITYDRKRGFHVDPSL